jgi:UTP--glucose-1-phosphate uridylyltransferase
MTTYPVVEIAVIPAAGLGTRFLPATKAVPKELLPIVDIPTVQYIVQEAIDSGIEKLVFITGKGKDSIIDHFEMNRDLAEKLRQGGKPELAERLNEQSGRLTVIAVRQDEPRGLGHAVLCARSVIGDQPFAVLLGDDLVDAKVPCTKQMIDQYNRYGQSVVALMNIPPADISRFGVVGGEKIQERVLKLNQMVEKPNAKEAPSSLAIVGRYILTPRIFNILENTNPGRGGEIQLTDAMAQLMREEGFIGYEFDGLRHDAGDKLGFLEANVHYALKRPEFRDRFLQFLREIVERES